MVRFLRKWLVPLLAGLILIGIVIAFVPFSRQMETRAKTELTLLMDRAFARISAEEQLADPIIEAEEESLLSKAAAVSRFLTHDDSLLASDALTALCEQLSIDRIDVANIEGTLTASSDAARIGTTLGTQEGFAWTMAAVNDATAKLTQPDETDPSVIYACVGRSDIEGFVLLTRDDAQVESALTLSSAESSTSDLPYGGDILFAATEGGADGFFYESGNLCLRRTQGDVTMIAARPTSEVYAVRSATILAFAAALACVMICGVAAYLINLEPVSAEDDEDLALDAAEEAAESQQDQPESGESQEEQPKKRRRIFQKRERLTEEAQEQIEVEVEQQHEQSLDHAPRQISRGSKRPHSFDSEEVQKDDEDAFEKIVE